MREILFRGKRIDNEEWVYGSFCMDAVEQFNGLCGVDGFIRLYDKAKDKMQMHEVDRETVGQFTGLTDKNGKRIFEDDVIHLDYIGKNRGVEGIATVIFENGKFGVKWGWHKEFVCLDGFANTTLEIVGNIHDNTQLSERGVENAPDVR